MAQKKQTQPRKSNFLVKCTGESKNKQYSWRLVAANGKITASGTGLNKKPSKAYVENLIKQLQNCVVVERVDEKKPLSKTRNYAREHKVSD